MKKTELRKIYKDKRSRLSLSEVESLSLGLLRQLKEFDFSEKKSFHCFLPIPDRNEVDTFPITDWLFESNKTIVVPAVREEEMISCRLQPDYLVTTGPFNTLEPMECTPFNPLKIDVILMPMLICDKSGNRVGYGGGYYDRFLKKCRADILKIGLSFFAPIKKISDVIPEDVPLDYCVTPDSIVSFTEE